MMKVDIRKAFDTVDWKFLHAIFLAFEFPIWLVSRIMECITSARFSIFVNGELADHFPTMKGLRQGDLMLPFLFVLAMEVL